MSDDLERTILQAFPPQPLGKAAKELRHLAGTTDPAAKLEFVVSPGGDGRQLIFVRCVQPLEMEAGAQDV